MEKVIVIGCSGAEADAYLLSQRSNGAFLASHRETRYTHL